MVDLLYMHFDTNIINSKLDFNSWRISEIKHPDPKIKYKRRIFLGRHEKLPELTCPLYIGSKNTIEDEIDHPSFIEMGNNKRIKRTRQRELSLFPVLLVWENNNGDKNYVQVESSEQ